MRANAQASEPGIYLADTEQGGTQIRRNDGGGMLRLGERVHKDFGEAEIFSRSNDNRICRIQLTFHEPLPEVISSGTAVLSFGIDYLVIDSRGSNNNETFTLGASIHGEQAARRIAAHFDIEPKLRSHPGYLILTRLVPIKESFEVGEPIELKLEIENVGEKSVSFMDGGQQRGPRNNQFKFFAFRNSGFGKAILDTGDPTNFGGIAGMKTLKPGEIFEKTANLSDWFELDEADSYQITGLFELNVVNEEDWREIWQDYAVGVCQIQVHTKE